MGVVGTVLPAGISAQAWLQALGEQEGTAAAVLAAPAGCGLLLCGHRHPAEWVPLCEAGAQPLNSALSPAS